MEGAGIARAGIARAGIARKGGPTPADVPSTEQHEREFQRAAAVNMAAVRAAGVVFVLFQTWMYVPPAGVSPPFELWLLAAGVGLAAALLTVLGLRASRSDRVATVRLGSWCEIGGDTAIVTAVVFGFSFDPDSHLWALMALPAMEAAWRHRVLGALTAWTALTLGYVAREVFAAARYEHVDFLADSVTYRTGLTLVITMVAALIARSMHRAHLAHLATTRTLIQQAQTDMLTGLANRSGYLESLAHALDRDEDGAAILLDVDGFGLVNDSRGPIAGDVVLTAFAQRLTAALDGSAAVARTAGDEFGVLLTGRTVADVQAVAERLQDCLATPVHAGGRRFHLTASAAVVSPLGGRHGANEVLHDLSLTMHVAKEQGPGALARFTPAVAGAMDRRATLLHDVRTALANGGVHVVYQPILHADADRVAGFEALVRWRHPRHGAIPPPEIVEAAEAAGVGADLFHLVLADACHHLTTWRLRLGTPFMAVNVAAHQVEDVKASFGQVDEILAAHALHEDALVLEITESDAVAAGTPIDGLLIAAHRRGIRVAIDDFGRGHSSLARLRTLEADIVKLDRELVVDLTAPERDPAALRAVVQLVNAHGYDAVAEGIETAHQHRAVVSAGCRWLQGFRFAEPMAPSVVTDWLAARQCPSPRPGREVGPRTAAASAATSEQRI